METASCSILYTLRFRGGSTAATTITTQAASTAKLYYRISGKRLCGNSLLASPGNCHCYSFGRKLKKRWRSDQFIGNVSTRNTTESNPSQKFAVLLEVERSVYFLSSLVVFFISLWVSCNLLIVFLRVSVFTLSSLSIFLYFDFRANLGRGVFCMEYSSSLSSVPQFLLVFLNRLKLT